MRSYLLAALLTCCLRAVAVDGFNQPGFDYANFAADSVLVCRNSCAGESKCLAWTWVKPGIEGSRGRCWLKSRIPKLVKDNCCNSGAGENILVRDLKAEGNTNRPGSDYQNFENDSWQSCQDACGNDQKCVAWTHVRAGVQGPRGRCWLKSKAAYPLEDQNCVSGVKLQPRVVLLDNND